ncbi:hypothetical protein RDWZM_008320, partial [Blomia tropicalis]
CHVVCRQYSSSFSISPVVTMSSRPFDGKWTRTINVAPKQSLKRLAPNHTIPTLPL